MTRLFTDPLDVLRHHPLGDCVRHLHDPVTGEATVYRDLARHEECFRIMRDVFQEVETRLREAAEYDLVVFPPTKDLPWALMRYRDAGYETVVLILPEGTDQEREQHARAGQVLGLPAHEETDPEFLRVVPWAAWLADRVYVGSEPFEMANVPDPHRSWHTASVQALRDLLQSPKS